MVDPTNPRSLQEVDEDPGPSRPPTPRRGFEGFVAINLAVWSIVILLAVVFLIVIVVYAF